MIFCFCFFPSKNGKPMPPLLLLLLFLVSTAGLSVAGPSAAPDAIALWQVCDVTKHGAIGDNKVTCQHPNRLGLSVAIPFLTSAPRPPWASP